MTDPKLGPGDPKNPKVSQVRVTVRNINDDYKITGLSIVTDVLPGIIPPASFYSMEIKLKIMNGNWIPVPWKEIPNEPCDPTYHDSVTNDPDVLNTVLITKMYDDECSTLPLIPTEYIHDIVSLQIRLNDEDPYLIGGYPPEEDSNNRPKGYLATLVMNEE